MPAHKQVTTCLKTGGTVSDRCSCYHCTIAVCAVCGAYEGSLTTDCPGEKVSFDKQTEVYETPLDYTDARGWHLGESILHRTPRFDVKHTPRLIRSWIPPRHFNKIAGCACGWSIPPETKDPERAIVEHVATANGAPGVDWSTADRRADLQHDLTRKAIAWVQADRSCDDQAARELTARDAVAARMAGQRAEQTEQVATLLAALEHEKIAFHAACRRAEECEDEFKQAARRIVDALENKPSTYK